jgi:ribosomal protein S18 acetylase RimI-like enzyme
MSLTTGLNRPDIVTVASEDDSHEAIKLALKNPLKNSFMLAQLTQLRQECTLLVKKTNDRVSGLIGYYRDLPYNNIDFIADTYEAMISLFNELAVHYPNLKEQPIYGLYDEIGTEMIERCFYVVNKIPELKMVLSNNEVPDVGYDRSLYKIKKLSVHDISQISELYSCVPAMAWTPKLLTYGPYYGAYHKQKLVSIAGVQYVTQWAAEVGNVVTHSDYRRRGLAHVCSKLVIDRLKKVTERIILYVLADNYAPLNLYHKMGFKKAENSFLVQYYLK